MAVPFATAADVAVRWRPLSSAETEVATQLANDASTMVRERWPDVDSRVTAGTLLPDTLERIVALMVKRAMISGDTDGLESRSQTAGPFSISDKFSNPLGNLYFTSADEAVLAGADSAPAVRMGWLA